MNLKNLFATIFILTLVIFAGCGKEDSPETALLELQAALSERDAKKLSNRVDIEKFFIQIYEGTTIELAENYDYYKKTYPDDPYFQQDAEFLKNYNEEYKAVHLKFAEDVVTAYFAKLPEPATPKENPEAYVANEFEKIRRAVSSEVKSVVIDNDTAEMTVNLNGDSTLIGQFVSDLDLKLGFNKDENGKWHLTKIENLDELTPLIVDKAEIIWINFF